jgi:alkylation response protein AidB-like acyl-CoA dehydrogenase
VKEGALDSFLNAEQIEFRDQLRRWVVQRLEPRAAELDRTGEFARDLFLELGELGYFGIMYPEKYGGTGLDQPYLYYTLLCEELARATMGFAATVCMHGSTATHTIFKWGNEVLRQQYLLPAIRGEKIGAFAITEPNAGSDAAAIKTRAREVDGGWRLNGTKIFTSNGLIADFITVAATTDPSKGARAIKLFLLDTSNPGFRAGKRLEKFTTHCSDTVELLLDDVFVPSECYLSSGDQGMKAYESLTVDRIFTAALALGNGEAAYEAALRYAQERHQFGRPISKFQAVQFKLVDMLAIIEQARLYTYQAAVLADRGLPITKEAAMAKIVAGDGCNEVCQKALNIFGGYGLMTEFPVQRYLRDSYFPPIGGGTSDIMRLIVTRQLGL